MNGFKAEGLVKKARTAVLSNSSAGNRRALQLLEMVGSGVKRRMRRLQQLADPKSYVYDQWIDSVLSSIALLRLVGRRERTVDIHNLHGDLESIRDRLLELCPTY